MASKWFFKIAIGLSATLLLLEGLAHLSIAFWGTDSWAMSAVSEARRNMQFKPQDEYIRGFIALLATTAGIFALWRGGLFHHAYGVLLCLLLASSAWTNLMPEWHQGLRSTQELLIVIILFMTGGMIALGLGKKPRKSS